MVLSPDVLMVVDILRQKKSYTPRSTAAAAWGFIRIFDIIRIFRREDAHQRPAADCETGLIQRIKPLAPILPDADQSGLFQLFQMVADRRLVDPAAELIHHIIDAQPDAAQVLLDLLARVVSQHFGEKNRIDAHIIYYIDMHQYVKGYPKSIASCPPPSRSMAMIF
jgi:hypothetical protein